MAFLKGFLIVLEVITSALLVCVILVQKTKGGMGTAMGGMGEQVFGSRMGNVLTKATVWLVAIFLINTIIIARMGSTPLPESVTDVNPVEQAVPVAPPMVPPLDGPAVPPVPVVPPTATPSPLDMPAEGVPDAEVVVPVVPEAAVEPEPAEEEPVIPESPAAE